LLELVGETMRRTLDDIARVAPEWLQEQMQPEWIKRYGRRFDSYRLPKGNEKRLKLATTIGRDGYYLLNAVLEESAPAEIQALPMIDIMRRIWVQQFYWCEKEHRLSSGEKTILDLPSTGRATYSYVLAYSQRKPSINACPCSLITLS
jgi:hypothetical protein